MTPEERTAALSEVQAKSYDQAANADVRTASKSRVPFDAEGFLRFITDHPVFSNLHTLTTEEETVTDEEELTSWEEYYRKENIKRWIGHMDHAKKLRRLKKKTNQRVKKRMRQQVKELEEATKRISVLDAHVSRLTHALNETRKYYPGGG